jgi:hypothetical protein
VLPYLWDLARAEKQLSWRMGAAFMFMLMSKASGGSSCTQLHVQLPAKDCQALLLKSALWSAVLLGYVITAATGYEHKQLHVLSSVKSGQACSAHSL